MDTAVLSTSYMVCGDARRRVQSILEVDALEIEHYSIVEAVLALPRNALRHPPESFALGESPRPGEGRRGTPDDGARSDQPSAWERNHRPRSGRLKKGVAVDHEAVEAQSPRQHAVGEAPGGEGLPWFLFATCRT